MKTEWTWLALVENAAALADEVKPVGPSRISGLHPVVETVNQRGEFDAQLAHARAGNNGALGLVPGAAEENIVFDIGLHLPHVGGMRLKDVNGVEADLVAILLGELVQGGNLPPKWRSGIAAEDQDHRPVDPKRLEVGG
jgi:hypothetical protein